MSTVDLNGLEMRYRSLLQAEARAKAAHERAQTDLQEAQTELAALGLSSVEDAHAWLAEAKAAIAKSVADLDATLREHGV